MKKQYLGLIIVVVIVLIMISSFIIYNQWPLMTGNKIVLATQPVDPFDPFRGQYMNINYKISSINDIEGFEEGDTIYVSLEENLKEGVWEMKDSSKLKPNEGYFIRGHVTQVYENNIRVEYGIEQFFFERNAELPTRNITAEVSVSNSGRAMLVQLLYNGEPLEIGYEKFNIKS